MRCETCMYNMKMRCYAKIGVNGGAQVIDDEMADCEWYTDPAQVTQSVPPPAVSTDYKAALLAFLGTLGAMITQEQAEALGVMFPALKRKEGAEDG